MRLIVLAAFLGATLSAQPPFSPGQLLEPDRQGGFKRLELKPWFIAPAPSRTDEQQKNQPGKWKLWDFRAAPKVTPPVPLKAQTNLVIVQRCAIPLVDAPVKNGDDRMIRRPSPSLAFTMNPVPAMPSCNDVGR
jgi:hypothetical protein